MIPTPPPPKRNEAIERLEMFEHTLRCLQDDSRYIEGYTPIHTEMYGHLLRLAGIVRTAITEAGA